MCLHKGLAYDLELMAPGARQLEKPRSYTERGKVATQKMKYLVITRNDMIIKDVLICHLMEYLREPLRMSLIPF